MKDLQELAAYQFKHRSVTGNKRTTWNVPISEFAKLTHNPIRAIVEGLNIAPNPAKPFIALSIGDPTTFGNLQPPEEIKNAVREAVDKNSNGYGPAAGFLDARQAVAEYVAHQGDVSANDVILCSGCSSALDLCLSALAGRGQNILIPRPGFSIYRTLTQGFGVECRYYNLLPDKNWEVDLDQLESLIDSNTAALVLTNPSNPCGSVFSKSHLKAIIEIAERHYLPIVADEIYEHFVFPGQPYYSVSSLSTSVPVLSCGGLTKRFLVPGWRLGWIIIHDRQNILKDVRKGLANLSARIMGSNTLVQSALPEILSKTPQSFYEGLVETLQRHAEVAYKSIKQIRGLRPVMPSGAMYMMIGIDIMRFPGFASDLDFVEALVREQSVFCLPGQCFEYSNYFRIVLTVPEDMIAEACKRLEEFVEKHYQMDENIIAKPNNATARRLC
ncbi:tyrosine aminotransferase [Uranotaenia lowii]|uniref:tyrosine aminotransferase n=1 Tax=Uranotaenia lowii TaxID=190385 RepID=UPI002479CD0E|nr:tyrosine aminotransferase [Uranotaenia lowii]